MSRNIGFTKKRATAISILINSMQESEAYVQREDHWPRNPNTPITGKCQFTHQWIVVIQKRQAKEGASR